MSESDTTPEIPNKERDLAEAADFDDASDSTKDALEGDQTPEEATSEEEEEEEKAEEKKERVPLPKPSSRRWGMNPEDRLRVMEACLVLPRAGWLSNFILMMSMSVIVAIMGLSANSPALVIGAMLIAPLMTPVLGIAASIAMALGDAVVRSLVTVAAATTGAIAVSWLIAGWLPGELLTNEVLARTAPDARDLVVALAAGIAGSYATARPDVSSSLPGVAIAVALVPPLAVVGITMRAGEGDLALGALLLYGTNLAAIVTVSTIIFVIAGFVPGRRLASMAPRVIAGGVIAFIVVAILGVVLGLRSYDTANRSTQIDRINAATRTWLIDTFNEFDVDLVDDTTVRVQVTGPSQLPSSADLRTEIATILGEPPDLRVTWLQGQTTDGIVAAEEEANRTAAEQAAAEERELAIDEVIDEWLAATGDASAFERTGLEISSETVTVSLASTAPAPELQDLQQRLRLRLNEPEVLTALNFEDLSAGEFQRRIDESLAAARTIVQDFAVARDLSVDGVSYDGTTLVADLRGELPPDGAELEAALRQALDESTIINVFFIERQPVVPAPTPTPEPTPTPTPEPTPEPTPTPDPDADQEDGEDGADDSEDLDAEDDTDSGEDPDADN